MIKKLPYRLIMLSINLFLLLIISLPTVAQDSPYEVIRLNDGDPIIYPTMFQGWYDRPNVSKDGGDGSNINGPSLIRVPDWIDTANRADPTAQYYLYFAHHAGDYIRMAWAADIEGPYTLYDDLDENLNEDEDDVEDSAILGLRGVLDNGEADILLDNDTRIEENHLASPDVIVDDVNQRIIMYFHSGSSYFVGDPEVEQNDQVTWVSTSPYGLEFRDNIEPVHFGSSYFRIFEHGGEMYALDNGARINRALDAADPWAIPNGHDFADHLWDQNPEHVFKDMIPESTTYLRVRHTGVRVVGDELHIFYSRRGDIQERIQMSTLDLSEPNWENWAPTYPPYELLAPNPGWEGGDRDLRFSETSDGVNVNQLRDPDFFEDSDGQMYIIYTGNGEDGIGIAKLYDTPTSFSTLPSIDDTYTKESSNYNAGSSTQVQTTTGTSTESRTVYMKFDLTGVSDLEHAVVRLYATDIVTETIIDGTTPLELTAPITAYEITDDSWSEGIVNGNSPPPSLGDVITTTHVTTIDQYYDWNITEYAKENLGSVFSIAFDIAPTEVSTTYDIDDPTKSLEATYKFGSKEQTDSSKSPQLIYASAAEVSGVLSTENIAKPVDMTLNTYPNPFSDNFTVDIPNYDGKSVVRAELMSFSGSTIISKEIKDQRIEFNNISLPLGVYLLKVNYNNGETLVKKMVNID